MDVKQRQGMSDGVTFGPGPGVGQGVEVGGDRPAGQDGPLGRTGCARRVDDQRRRLGIGDRAGVGAPAPSGGSSYSSTAIAGTPARAPGAVLPGASRRPRSGITDNVIEFTGARAGVDRDRRDTREQRANTATQVSMRASASTATRSFSVTVVATRWLARLSAA